MKYTEEFYKKVILNTDLVSLIGDKTHLKKYDNVYIGKCIFNKVDGDTLVVYPEKNVFHCFGCGENGNAAAWLMKTEGIQMDEAIEALAKRACIEITESDLSRVSNAVLKANLYNIYKDAAIFYVHKLKSEDGAEARAYYKERGLTNKTVKDYGLGYAPSTGNVLYKYLKAKGYDLDLMQIAGLVRTSESGPYDMFRGRAIFPILDENRRVVAFSGRVLGDTKPKYLNSPESIIFYKSNILYGLHAFDNNVSNKDLILCEGCMDVIALHQAGYKNAVATLGTAFTATHIPVVQKHTDRLILNFDSDDAGQKAAMRTLRVLERSGLNVKVVTLDPCKDPDEFIKNYGADEYQARIDTGLDQINFQLKYLSKRFDIADPSQKNAYITEAVNYMLKQQERAINRDEMVFLR